ncbi:MAG: hypothetical protein WB760_22000 [Xanthobacteraceae bacterium]
MARQVLFVPATTPSEILRKVSIDINTGLANAAPKNNFAKPAMSLVVLRPQNLACCSGTTSKNGIALLKSVNLKLD